MTSPVDDYQPSLTLPQFVPLIDNGALPLGVIRTLAGDQAGSPHPQGQLLQIAQNQALFAVVGKTYGGDGTTTFALPDLQGRTPIGVGQGIGLGINEVLGVPTGSANITLTEPQLPSSLGGSFQPYNNYEPSLPITYLIATDGFFPTQNGGAGNSIDFVGAIVPFAGNSAPAGFMPADGQVLPISQYDTLFNLIGTTYGGDGQTTFQLPDLRGRTIIGASSQTPLATTEGQQQVTLSNANIPVSVGGGGQAIDNREPSLALSYIIALQGVYPDSAGDLGTSNQFLGEVVAFAGNFAPAGWAFADGHLLSVAQNSALFALIGTTYGGDGVNSFALPDLRDRAMLGTGTGASAGETFGADTVTLSSANIPDLHLIGTSGDDTLYGGDGNDTIIGSTGNDKIKGGGGTNTVDYSPLSTSGLVAVIHGGHGTVNKGGANGSDTLTGIQTIIDTGAPRSNGDVFYVDAGETVTANNGNFNYLIELSAGVNLFYGTNFTGISEFVSNVGTNTLDFSNDSHFAYVYGSTGNDTLTLGTGGGYLFGEGGTNTLTGGANATNLFVGGQSGTDTMNGGTGTASNFYFVDGLDQVNGAGAFNTVIELVTGVTVQLGGAQYQHVQEFVSNGGNNAVTVANTDSEFTYLYGGTGNDTLTTGSGGGYLFGEGGANVLTGGGGTNVFVADNGSGVDTMNGGNGSNIYFVDSHSTVHGAGTFNTVIELQQNASLTLGSAQLGTDVQQVVLNGGTNTVNFSSATSAVFLYGGAGNDTLFGGTGNDFLYGGAGTNTFKFATGWGHDTIMGWTAGTNNQIDLTALAGLGVHQLSDLSQSTVSGSDVITSSHTGTNSITLNGFGSTLTAASFHFA